MKWEYCDGNGLLKPEIFANLSPIKEVSKNIGVLCLTRRDSTLMWSHYADKNYGLSIQFDVTNNIPLSKMNYAEELPKARALY